MIEAITSTDYTIRGKIVAVKLEGHYKNAISVAEVTWNTNDFVPPLEQRMTMSYLPSCTPFQTT